MTAEIIHIHELEDELAFSSLAEVYFTRDGEVVAASPLALKLLGYQSYELRQLFIAQLMPQALRLLDVCHYQALSDKPVVFARKQGGRFAAKVEHKERLVAFPGEVLSLQAMCIHALQPGSQIHQKVRSNLTTALPKQCLLDLNGLRQSSLQLCQSLRQETQLLSLAHDFAQAQSDWQQDLSEMLEQQPQSQTTQRVFNLPLALSLWQQGLDYAVDLIIGDNCAEIVLAEQDKLLLLLNTVLDLSQCQSDIRISVIPAENPQYSRVELCFSGLESELQQQFVSALQVWQQGDFYAQLNCLNAKLVLGEQLSFSFDYLLMPVIQGRSMDCLKGQKILLLDERAQAFSAQLRYWGGECHHLGDGENCDLIISSGEDPEGMDGAHRLLLQDDEHLVDLANRLCAVYQQAPLWHYSQGAMARRQQSLCLPQQNAVLLVSDNLDFCQAMQSLIEQDNCYLVCAVNALDAILAAQEKAYQAIVLDCQLESMPAFETLVHMRSNALLNRHCHVFAVSQEDNANMRLAAAEVGLKHIYLQQHLNLLATDLHRYLIDAEQAQLDLDLLDLQQELSQLRQQQAYLNADKVGDYLMAWGAERLACFSLAALKQLSLGIQLWRLCKQKLCAQASDLERQQLAELESYLISLATCLGFSCVARALEQSFAGGDNFAQQQLQQVLLQQSLEHSRRALWFEFGLSC